MITPLDLKRLNQNSAFFIGWYNKFSDKNKSTYVVIAGFFKEKRSKPKAFIQYFNNSDSSSKYLTYTLNECEIDIEKQKISIGPNSISLNQIKLNLSSIKIIFNITKINAYKYKGLGKNILGPLHYIPLVECKHSILNIRGEFEGTISHKNNEVDVKGLCYQEKDWGKSFPSKYFWIHADNFDTPAVSFQFAYAKTKWLLFKPKVYIGFLEVNNQIINLNKLGNTKIHIEQLTESKVEIILTKNKYIISIMLISGNPISLKGPINGIMNKNIGESLTSKLIINITDKRSPSKSFKISTEQASSEVQL